MAVLDMGIDTAAVSPVRRSRRLGSLFWLAVGWIAFIVLAATFAGLLPLPPQPTWTCWNGGRRRAWSIGSAPTPWAAMNWRGFSMAPGYRSSSAFVHR